METGSKMMGGWGGGGVSISWMRNFCLLQSLRCQIVQIFSILWCYICITDGVFIV